MSPEDWQIVWFTAWVSALSTIVILPFGLAAGVLLARCDWPGKSVVETIISLPLVMPPVATGLILLGLLGRRGALGGFLHGTLHLDIVFTWLGVLVSLCVMSFPLLVRSARVVTAKKKRFRGKGRATRVCSGESRFRWRREALRRE